MPSQNETVLRLFRLLTDVGKAALILAVIAGAAGAVGYVWLAGASLKVVNESGQTLENVRLLAGHSDAARTEIWKRDMENAAAEWTYTFAGKDRAVLQYRIGDRTFESECLYPSEGVAVSANMSIHSDGSLTCESDLRM